MTAAVGLPLARSAHTLSRTATQHSLLLLPASTGLQRRLLSTTSSSSSPSPSPSPSPSQQRAQPLTPAARVRRVQQEVSLPSSSSRWLSSTAAPDVQAEAGPVASAAPTPTWHPTSRRVGLITRKIGMTSFFLSTGQHIPATVLQVMSNQISAHVSPPTGAYTAMQVAAFDVHSKRGITEPIKGHLLKAGIHTPKRLSAVHFVPGQHVDVRAITRGKGFNGAMKRHGFHGLRASHGVSISHRSHGSTGQHQDPGRVFPGKKMAGRMGGTAHRTVQNARVLRVDSRDELLFVQGQVPGPEGGTVYVSDAKRALVGKAAGAFGAGKLRNGQLALGNEPSSEYLPEAVDDLPFPAGTKQMAALMPEVVELGPVKRVAAAATTA
ncbi:unnamed protein product [Tilletia laevis]|uniref:Large ribosomal subunit protein uL3m n=2 Tax=Tilletia TaxID=13289 RepID=A0A9N8LRL9_9BASI|nr:unnamed protein product [Tilletia caries]CAD6896632.1 unnamed protein product [Tilletia controversa]CAD6937468.1 unnamed protein product [Tilletia laevis]CAD6907123.1 unnamed protein product [Tilletia controversa]CAD6936720.1 unnamed protein product [Tilletia caries]